MTPLFGSNPDLNLLGFVLRALLVMVVLFVLIRVAGKRQLTEMNTFDFALAITIGALAAAPLIHGKVSVVDTLVSMLTLTFWQVILAFLALKSRWFARLVGGGPTVVIENGKISKSNLARTGYNLTDLLSQLRAAGTPNITDVEFAVLETDGKLSVIRKSQEDYTTCGDMGIPTSYVGMPTVLIEDGRIVYENLKLVNLDKYWLDQELQKKGISSPKEVFLATLDTAGGLYIDRQPDHG